MAVEPRERCLHLVMKANAEALNDCRDCCNPADTIVLMNDAVTLMAGPVSNLSFEMNVPVFCLEADVRAHGLADVFAARGAGLLDDHQLVRLVCQHRHCMTWK